MSLQSVSNSAQEPLLPPTKSVQRTKNIETNITTPNKAESPDYVLHIDSISNSNEIEQNTILNSAPSKEITTPKFTPLGMNLDPALIRVAKPKEESLADYHKEMMDFVTKPAYETKSALETVTNELGKLQKSISLLQPKINGKEWDFSLKDGKIEVSGAALNKSEKQWLENTLNRNEKLVGAVSQYYNAVVTFFENTPEHTSPIAQSNQGPSKNEWALNVAEQINGKLNIREMLRDSYGVNSNYNKALDDVQKILVTTTIPKYSYNNSVPWNPASTI